MLDDLHPNGRRDLNFTEEPGEQFKIGKRRQIDQRTAVGDDDHSITRRISRWQLLFDLIEIRQVIGQVAGGVVIVSDAPATS